MKEGKNLWASLLKQEKIEGLSILLIELNTAALNMKTRYCLAKEVHFAKSDLFAAEEGVDRAYIETSNTHQGLHGVGAALIISVNELVKEVKNYQKNKNSSQNQSTNRSNWVDSISSASNFVRHGIEWRESAIEILGGGNLQEVRGRLFKGEFGVDELMDGLSRKQKVNIESLYGSGISIQRILNSTGDYWYLAEKIRCGSLELSLQDTLG